MRRLYWLTAAIWSWSTQQTSAAPNNLNLTDFSANTLPLNTSAVVDIGLSSSVPDNFQLDFEIFQQDTLQVGIVWPKLFVAATHAAWYDFRDALVEPWRLVDDGIRIDVSPEAYDKSNARRFRLQRGHAVWTIARLADMIYKSRKYAELDATINIEGRVRGRLELRRSRNTAGLASTNQTQDSGSIDDVSNATSVETTLALLNETGSFAGQNSSDLEGRYEPKHVQTLFLSNEIPNGKPIKKTDAYLFFIRTVAQIAPWPAPVPIMSSQTFVDHDLKLKLSIEISKYDTQHLVAWGDGRQFLKFMAIKMLDKARPREYRADVVMQNNPDPEEALLTMKLESLAVAGASDETYDTDTVEVTRT